MFMPIADPSISLEENTQIAIRQNGRSRPFPKSPPWSRKSRVRTPPRIRLR